MTTTSIPSSRVSKKSRTVYDVIPDGDYPARIVGFVGLGVQDQPEFKGEKKAPAFKCTFHLELIGLDATGTVYENDQDKVGKPIEAGRPAVQFYDVFLFPGAARGKVFDLCTVLEPGIKEVPGHLEWFTEQLGQIVSARIGHYDGKAGRRNKVVGVTSIPNMFKSQVGEARVVPFAYNPYADTTENLTAYSNLPKWVREVIADAHDKEHIPFAGKEPVKPSDDEKPLPKETGGVNPEPSVTEDDDVPF